MSDSNETPSSEEAAQEATPSGAYADLLSGIKDGDRQKYNTVEDALNSIQPSQEFIAQLKSEKADLQQQLEAAQAKAQEAKTVEDLMSKINETERQADQPSSEQTFDEGKMVAMIQAQMERTQRESVARQNSEVVMKAFQERHGEKAAEAYNQMAQDAGLTGDMLKTLAETSPKVVLQLAGFDQKASMPGKTESTVRTEGFGDPKNLPSAKVKMVGATSQELVDAWKNTEVIVNSR